VVEAREPDQKVGTFVAAHDITFAIRPGNFESWAERAGKSTTFKMMCGLLAPTSARPWWRA
jgi:ABC-2 type transport system ATP-binding protein